MRRANNNGIPEQKCTEKANRSNPVPPVARFSFKRSAVCCAALREVLRREVRHHHVLKLGASQEGPIAVWMVPSVPHSSADIISELPRASELEQAQGNLKNVPKRGEVVSLK